MNTPIDCALHDHVEIACLFRYDLEVELRDGRRVRGRARTTRTGADKLEVLVLDGGQDIRLDRIARLRVLTPNARFDVVDFGEPPAAP